MNYKAVVADVDGTLLPPTARPAEKPSLKLMRTVAAAVSKGIIFSIATARSLPWITDLIDNLSVNGPAILDNGARIYDLKTKRYIWESFVPKDTVNKVIPMLQADPALDVFFTDDTERLSDLSLIRKWKVTKIVVLSMIPEKAEEVYKKLSGISGVMVTKSISGHNPLKISIHVTNKDANKRVAVEKFAEYLKISPSAIIGIGDSYNDYPMLTACGLKVAMGNAIPEIKKIADYIAPSYLDDGVANVIEKFILSGESV